MATSFDAHTGVDREHQSRDDLAEAERLEGSVLYARAQILSPDEWVFERDESFLASALSDLRQALETGLLTESLRRMLADFVASVRARQDPGLARRILGLPARVGAPSKRVLWWEAESNYQHWIETGHSEAEALRVCWETLYPDKNYERELRRPYEGASNAYEGSIKKIKQELNRRGVRKASPRGRKKKENSA